MLISVPELVKKYDLKINGVIQVGAHWAEEDSMFNAIGVNRKVYIEPSKKSFDILLKKFQPEIPRLSGSWENVEYSMIDENGQYVFLINCACADQEGECEMVVSNQNQGQSNSLLQPKLHLQQHPEVIFNDTELVQVRMLDTLMLKYVMTRVYNLEEKRERFNFIMADVQGSEGLLFKGATKTLRYIDYIYTEVNRGQTYEGNMEIGELDEFLGKFGFERKETFWPSPNWTWGDAFYIKNK